MHTIEHRLVRFLKAGDNMNQTSDKSRITIDLEVDGELYAKICALAQRWHTTPEEAAQRMAARGFNLLYPAFFPPSSDEE